MTGCWSEAASELLINSQPDLAVVAGASNGRQAITSPSVVAADVILMDVRLPQMDGIETTEYLLSRLAPDAPGARVSVLTTFGLDEYALAAIRAGASGFLLKDVPPEELLESIRTRKKLAMRCEK